MSLGNGSQGHPQSSLEELVFFFISFYFRHFLGMIYFRYFYPHGDLIINVNYNIMALAFRSSINMDAVVIQ